MTVSGLSDVALVKILEECGVIPEQYDNTLGCMFKKGLNII